MVERIFYGIDFGTTNTAVTEIIVDDLGEKFQNLTEEAEFPFSSIAAIPKNGGKMQFGRHVKNRRQELSVDYEIVTSIKTLLNNNEEVVVVGRKYTAIEITANFLLYVKEYIKDKYNKDITEATFAFPVDFKPESRTRLKESASLAGIEVLGFVCESTAAFISNKDNLQAFSKTMVVDWGGGTLDVSILDYKQKRLSENTVYGEELGGDDIDKTLAERIHAQLINKENKLISFEEMSNKDKDTIISACEMSKINFGFDDDDAPIRLRNYGEFGTKNISLSYEKFCDIILPIIKKALKIIDKTMEQAGVSKSGIDSIVLVGGSCGIRLFWEQLAMAFGDDKIFIPDKTQWAVALGAARVTILGNNLYLNGDVCLKLSDGSNYPLLEKEKVKIGTTITPITFSLTEDSKSANFIFTDKENSINYGSKTVNTKGFMNEDLTLEASIGIDQIATITINNNNMGTGYKSEHKINKLKFHYDLSTLN